MTTLIPALLNSLLDPHTRVTDSEKIQRSRLLSTILLVQTLVIVLVIVLVLYADPGDINEPTVKGAVLIAGVSVLLYIANRFGYTSMPALGYFLILAALLIYIPFYSGENPAFLAFMIIPLIFMAIFFSIKQTTAASIGLLVLIGVLLSFMDHSSSNLPYWNLRNMWYLLMLATGLILTFMRHLANLEQIRQQELRRINEQLEQKVAELEQFSYTVSHELKNPVVTIKGYLGSIEKDLQNNNFQRAQKDLARVSTASDKLQESISDLLELSKIGYISNKFEKLDPAVLIQEALKITGDSIQARNITVTVTPHPPAMYGDPLRLRDVYKNLIDNAIKHMGDRTDPVIEIGMQARSAGPVFYVKDNGMGIEARYHEKIFGLFEKLNPAIDGTGIGLAYVKRIIETHGGKIWVESEGLGEGSTFCFTIPSKETASL